ncbi:hypothetical protein C0992_000366 [Termitomyces sp. T32_za158]|nr:hypothetical protein C0992_000366 [Termitomyces sp. T32_za158]
MPMTYEAMAADVQHFITERGLEDARGGKVAMTLALSSTSPNLANLIVSDIAPTCSSLSNVRRYLWVMARLVHPAYNIRTREQADAFVKAEEWTISSSVREFLLTNLIVPREHSNETVKFKVPIDILRDALFDIGSFPYTPNGPHKWQGRTLVVKGAESEYVDLFDLAREWLFVNAVPIQRLESPQSRTTKYRVASKTTHILVDNITYPR